MNRYLWERRLRGCMAVLTPTEYVVLTMLALYTNRACEGARPSRAELCADTGFSVSTIRRSLGSLVSKGYLDQTREGKGRHLTNEYRLVWDMPHVAEFEARKQVTAVTPFPDEKQVTAVTPFPDRQPEEKGSHGDRKGVTAVTHDQVDQEKIKSRPPAASSTYVGQCERETRAASTEWSDGTPIGNPPDDLDAPPSRALTVVPDLDPPTEIDTHPAPRRRADITPSAATLVRYTLPPGLPREFITETEQIVTRQAHAGIDTDAIRAAVEKLGRRPGASPKLLPNLIADEVRARAAPAATETKATARARQTIADGQALINQLRAEGKLT